MNMLIHPISSFIFVWYLCLFCPVLTVSSMMPSVSVLISIARLARSTEIQNSCWMEFSEKPLKLVRPTFRYFPEYMEADTCTEQREVIRYIFCFAISTRVRDKKGNGESHPRKKPRNVKHHYNCKTTH